MRLFCWNACISAGFEACHHGFGASLKKIPADLHLFPYIKEDLRGIPVLLQAFAHRAKLEEGAAAGG
jgi:hypothetical protein